MTKKEAVAYFGTAQKLADALGVSKSTVSLWPEILPPWRQIQIMFLSECVLALDEGVMRYKDKSKVNQGYTVMQSQLKSDRKSETLKTLVTEEEKIKFIKFCNRINRSPSFVLRRLAHVVVNADDDPRLLLRILNA